MNKALAGSFYLALLVLCPHGAGAQTPNPLADGAVVGLGNEGCGKFLAARESKASIEYANYVSWVAGFLTGMNIASIRDSRVNIMTGTDALSGLAWMEKYCRENPLEQVIGAAVMLGSELSNRQKKR